MSLFSFFGKDDSIFDRSGQILVFSVFSDRVSVLLLKKESKKGGFLFSIIHSIIEPQEEAFSKGNFDFKKLKLNCGKLRSEIAKKKIKTKKAIFAFSPDVAGSFYISKSFERVDKEKDITQEEIDKMVLNVKSEFSKSGNLISLERLEKVLIDGYAMEDPLGLAGKEITVGISGVTSKSDVVKEFSGLASFLKLEFKGVFPIDFSVVEAKKHFSDLKDALFINIFENSASLFLLRSGFIDAIENADAGYGDFGRRLSENFSVGLEEAKNIKNKFISGDLDVNILDKARSLAFESAKVALGKIKPAISLLGRMDLLPKEIFISFFGDVPVQFSQAFKKSNNWFSDLPFSRDVEIAFLNASDFDNLLKDEKKLFTACEYAIIYHINKLK